MNEDGHTSSVRDKILSIRVKRGWKQGTRITFKEEGDQGPNTIPADISESLSSCNLNSGKLHIMNINRPRRISMEHTDDNSMFHQWPIFF